MTRKKKYYKPPFIAELILKFFFPDNGHHTTLGDIAEVYHSIAENEGLFRAKLWYWKQTYQSIMPLLTGSLFFGGTMLKNYIKLAFRNMWKDKLNSSINILGLSVGIAFALLIFLFVRNEFSYNKFHENAENIYRINRMGDLPGRGEFYGPSTPMPLQPKLVEIFPEIDLSTRIIFSSSEIKFNNFSSS